MPYKSVTSWRAADLDDIYGRSSGSQFNSLCKATVTVIIVGVGIKLTTKVINYLKKKKRVEYSLRKPDVVILHQFPRSATVPNLSPFVLKLETYLRLSKISYENDFKDPMGPKGKCPYITLNGEDICDSQLAIEYLNRQFNIDLDSNLTDSDRAVGHALRIMLENNLYWAAAYYRWVLEDSKIAIKQLIAFSFPWNHFIFNYIRRGVKKAVWYHGIGRHSKYEIMGMLHRDMKSLSVFLGDKKFLFGDKPSEVDCAVFGMLAQIMWTLPGTALEEYLKSDCPNLRQYCLSMKAEVWPDWDQCLYPKK